MIIKRTIFVLTHGFLSAISFQLVSFRILFQVQHLLGAHCFPVMGSSTNEIEGLVRIKSMQLRFIPSDFGYPVTAANDVISIWPLKGLFLEYEISL